MRPFPKLIDRTPAGIAEWVDKVEKLREEDRAEMALLSRKTADQGLLYVNTTTVGTVGSGEDDLMSYALPAGLLIENGWYVEFGCAFQTAANANSKRIRLYFGATLIHDSFSLTINAKAVSCWVTVIRTGASSQLAVVRTQSHEPTYGVNGQTVDVRGLSVSLSSPVTFKATGEGTSDNDVTQRLLTARWYPANLVASV